MGLNANPNLNPNVISHQQAALHNVNREEDFTMLNEDFPALPGSTNQGEIAFSSIIP
jgi:hypothetical protein